MCNCGCVAVQVLAEQQAGRKAAAASETERDRSPIRGNRAPLLPDPVPGSFAQIRPKRRTLLPTPPGVTEEPAAAAGTAAAEGSDPAARYGHTCTGSIQIHLVCNAPESLLLETKVTHVLPPPLNSQSAAFLQLNQGKCVVTASV